MAFDPISFDSIVATDEAPEWEILGWINMEGEEGLLEEREEEDEYDGF